MLKKEFTIQNHLESLLNTGVDHIMIVNERGRVESMATRSEICLSRERQEIFFMGIRLHQSLLQEFDNEFGPVNHLVVHRRNVKIVSVPFGSSNLLFVMDNDINHEHVVRKIEKIKYFSNIHIPEQEPLCPEVVSDG